MRVSSAAVRASSARNGWNIGTSNRRACESARPIGSAGRLGGAVRIADLQAARGDELLSRARRSARMPDAARFGLGGEPMQRRGDRRGGLVEGAPGAAGGGLADLGAHRGFQRGERNIAVDALSGAIALGAVLQVVRLDDALGQEAPGAA